MIELEASDVKLAKNSEYLVSAIRNDLHKNPVQEDKLRTQLLKKKARVESRLKSKVSHEIHEKAKSVSSSHSIRYGGK